MDEVLPQPRSLEGRVALITGAGGAIGSACAMVLAARGARVVCVVRPGADIAALTAARYIYACTPRALDLAA